jgi:hypothetical protein
MMTAIQLLLFVGVLFGFIVWVCQQAGYTLKNAVDIFSTLILICAFCALFLSLVSCDAKVTGNTTHTVQGEATVRMEIALDYCKDIPPEQKLECLETFADLIEMLKGDKELDNLIEEMEGGV